MIIIIFKLLQSSAKLKNYDDTICRSV